MTLTLAFPAKSLVYLRAEMGDSEPQAVFQQGRKTVRKNRLELAQEPLGWTTPHGQDVTALSVNTLINWASSAARLQAEEHDDYIVIKKAEQRIVVTQQEVVENLPQIITNLRDKYEYFFPDYMERIIASMRGGFDSVCGGFPASEAPLNNAVMGNLHLLEHIASGVNGFDERGVPRWNDHFNFRCPAA